MIEYNRYVASSMDAFWTDLRRLLCDRYGQAAGRRDRRVVAARKELAGRVQVPEKTLIGFMNDYQKTLPFTVLVELFNEFPGLKERYEAALGQHLAFQGASRPSARMYVQMEFQFDGFDDSPQTVTARIPAGREGTVSVRFVPRYFA
jgi:hypothetical protein